MLALISVRAFHTSSRDRVSLTLSLVSIAADFSYSDSSTPLPSAEEAVSVLDELLNFFLFFPGFYVHVLRLLVHFNSHD